MAAPAVAQAANFDDKPTGFLTATTGGMPADAWNGTSLATAKRLVSALPAAPRSRALRDLQFKVLVSELDAAGGRRQPAAQPVRAQGREAGGHGRRREPERDGAQRRRLCRSGDRHDGGQRPDDGGRTRRAPAPSPATRSSPNRSAGRANAACGYAARRNSRGAAAASVPAGQIDGPAMMMPRSHARPACRPACCASRSRRSSAPWSPSSRCRSPPGSRSPSAARRWPSSRRRGWAISMSRRCATAPRCRRRSRGARAARRGGAQRLEPRRDHEFDRSRSTARRAAARCSRPSRAPAPPACSACRPSRNSPAWRRKRCAASCCWATSSRRRPGLSSRSAPPATTRGAIIALDRLMPLVADRRHRRSQAPADRARSIAGTR